MKKPLKEKLKKIGGGHLLNEGPVKLGIPVMVNVGFSNEMGALYLTHKKKKGNSIELRKADVEAIIKQYKKFKNKMD
mgnify:CR=1 FL=1